MISKRAKVTLCILVAGVLLVALPLLRVWPTMRAMLTISDHGGDVHLGGFDHEGGVWPGLYMSLLASYYVKVNSVTAQIPPGESERQNLRDAISYLNPEYLWLVSSTIDDEEMGRIWKQSNSRDVVVLNCQLETHPFREIGQCTSIKTLLIRNSMDGGTSLLGLKDLTSLRSLSIVCESPTTIDTSSIDGFASLKSLYLWNVTAYDHQTLPILPALEYLHLRESMIDLGDISRIPAIKHIKSDNTEELRERYRDHSPPIEFTSGL